MSQKSTNKKISFRSKEKTTCLICKSHHYKESLFQGGGRLIAGSLTKELRRNYERSKNYGRVDPKDYSLIVCPNCLYSSYPKDWDMLDEDEIKSLKESTKERKKDLTKILGKLDFSENRNLVLGAGSYLLAIECYQKRNNSCAPTGKKAVSAIRAAWYFHDLHQEFKDMNFNKISDYLYSRSCYWYNNTLEVIQDGSESLDEISYMLGPDTDKNWNVDGVIYISSLLTVQFKDILETDIKKQKVMLEKAKINISKIYGSGKGSKDKPSFMLDTAKDLYDQLSELCKEK